MEQKYIEMMERQIAEGKHRREQAEAILQTVVFPEGMNKKQQKAMKNIIMEIPTFDFYGSDNYEVKEIRMDVQEYGSVYVVIETGMIDDEGTLASCLCRKRRTFWIGKKGGITVLNSKYNLVSIPLFKLMNEHYNK